MRPLPHYQPPRRPLWPLLVIWALSAVAVIAYAVVVATAAEPTPDEPTCLTHLECPVDPTP